MQCHHHFWKNPDHIVGHSSDINILLCFYKPYFLWFRTGRQVIPAMWRKKAEDQGAEGPTNGPAERLLGSGDQRVEPWESGFLYLKIGENGDIMIGIPKFQIFLGEIERPCQGNYSNYSLDEMQNLILGKT